MKYRTNVSNPNPFEQDSGALSATSPFTGDVRAKRIGNAVLIQGDLNRSSSFSTSFVDTGVTIPVGMRPSIDTKFGGSAIENTTTTYRFQVTTGGALQVAQSAAAPAGRLAFSGVYFVA